MTLSLPSHSLVVLGLAISAVLGLGCSSSSKGGGTADEDSGTHADTGAATDGSRPADTGPATDGASSSETSTPAGDASGEDGGAGFGQSCTSSTQCTSAVYDSCQMIMMQNVCTKACSSDADCPSPPTSGMCNMMGSASSPPPRTAADTGAPRRKHPPAAEGWDAAETETGPIIDARSTGLRWGFEDGSK